MKKAFFLILLATISMVTSAQLKVDADGKVLISSNQNTSYSKLLVGNNDFGGYMNNVGISSSTTVMNGKSNIGIFGSISADSNMTNDTNYGTMGIVNPINNTHGRNYGLCGMIGFTGNHYGGAGLYATSYTYFFNYPTNIQGDYAGYFAGSVYVLGNITVPNVFIPTDSRLSENVVSLNEKGKETNTLDNLLSMNVIEYTTILEKTKQR